MVLAVEETHNTPRLYSIRAEEAISRFFFESFNFTVGFMNFAFVSTIVLVDFAAITAICVTGAGKIGTTSLQ